MSQFKVGDRVRVRDLTAVGSYAGQVGVVVGLSRTLNPAPSACWCGWTGACPANATTVALSSPRTNWSQSRAGTPHDGVRRR